MRSQYLSDKAVSMQTGRVYWNKVYLPFPLVSLSVEQNLGNKKTAAKNPSAAVSHSISNYFLSVDPSRIHSQGFFEALHGGFQVVDADAVGDAGLVAALLGVGVEARGRG